jgi:hypothetical protein
MKSTGTLFGIITTAFALSGQVQAQSFLTNGLLAYYPFNGNVSDASGNGHNGTVYGATLTTNRFGSPNAAYYFDGVSGYITAPFANTVFTGDFTASVWFQAYDLTNGFPTMVDEENASFRFGISGDTCGCTPEYLYAYSSYGPATFSWTLNYYGQQMPKMVSCQALVTKAGSTVTMYFNGTSMVTNQVANNTTLAGSYLIFGKQFDQIAYTAFHGVLDDIRIYNRALPASEVQQLYAYERGPIVNLIKAVKPSFSGLSLGTNYQLQVSGDLNSWTNHGAPFAATNSSMVYPLYWDVENWNKLFFRVQVSP